MRNAILETFPEPNRKLLQRILMMMQTVASCKSQNRMSTSAVAACMAPLLLRPLLAGECDIETDFNTGDDGSIQLLQAAAAANHAQAIVITLLEEYDKIFGEGSTSLEELYSESEQSGSASEEATDDDESYEDDEQDDAIQESDAYTDDFDNASSRSCSESGDSGDSVVDYDKAISRGSKSSERNDKFGVSPKPPSTSHKKSLLQHADVKNSESNCTSQANESAELLEYDSPGTSSEIKLNSHSPLSCMEKSPAISNEPICGGKRRHVWRRTAARKNLSMESIDVTIDDEVEIQSLEDTKSVLQKKIADEVKGNEILEVGLEKRKKALQERRQALENDVARLQYELQKERDKRTAMEAGLGIFQGSFSIPDTIDEKTKVELGEITQAEKDIIDLNLKAKDLGVQLSEQIKKHDGSEGDSSNQLHQTSAKLKDKRRENDVVTDRSSNMDVYHDGAAESENEKNWESVSFPNKHPPQNQQVDAKHTVTSRSAAPIIPKKSGTRWGEGSNTTSFALTKLTTRLNFLKERRSQLANELLDKSRGSSQDKDRGSEPQQSLQNQDKSQISSEVQSVPKSEKGGECESSQSLQNLDKGVGKESQSLQDSGKIRKSSIFSRHTADGGKKPEPSHLDRGKSEGHVAYKSSDKSQEVEGQSHSTPTRTFSR